MKGNLKKAVIMPTSLGFMLGLALGKIHDDYRQQQKTNYSRIFIYPHSTHHTQASQMQDEIQLKVDQILRQAEELEKRAAERARRAEEVKVRFRCR